MVVAGLYDFSLLSPEQDCITFHFWVEFCFALTAVLVPKRSDLANPNKTCRNKHNVVCVNGYTNTAGTLRNIRKPTCEFRDWLGHAGSFFVDLAAALRRGFAKSHAAGCKRRREEKRQGKTKTGSHQISIEKTEEVRCGHHDIASVVLFSSLVLSSFDRYSLRYVKDHEKLAREHSVF